MSDKQEDLRESLAKIQKDLDALKAQAGEGAAAAEEKKPPDDKAGSEKKPASGATPAKKGKLSKRQKGLVAGAVVLFLLVGVYFLYEGHKYESTDDAYVRAYSTQLAPQVSARVVAVLVDENERVKSGQILAQLDRRDFTAALADAQASHEAIAAQAGNAEIDFRRAEALLRDRVITRQQYDSARASYLNFRRQAEATEAKASMAQLDLEHTALRAPSDGKIATRAVDVGQYVSSGTAIFGFVPDGARWVDANFKETQLAFLQPGRPAEVTVDALSGKRFAGVVQSQSPSTGATFTLLPPDNATGNFTKVVQRVPVRIFLKNLGPRDSALLQAGLSANVDILKHEPLQSIPSGPQPVFLTGDVENHDGAVSAEPSPHAQPVSEEKDEGW